jgi:predicted secreted protein
MADNVQGKNIMLYNTSYNAEYYLNGGISQATISGVPFKQLGTSQNAGSAVNSSISGDGLIAGFITNIGEPNQTSIVAGTWTISNHMGLYDNLSGAPKYFIRIFKYDGTTLTTIATSASYALVDTGAAHLYTTTISVPLTSLNSSDRIAIGFYAQDIGTRTLQVYSQGIYAGNVITTLAVDVPFACSTNCSFSVNVDQKEVTSQTSAWYRQYKNDIATWDISCDGLITLDNYGYLYLLQLQQSRASIFIKFVIDNGDLGLVIISGACNLTSLQINAPYKEIGTYSVSLQGSGAYGTSGTSINPSGTLIVGGSIYNKEYTAAGGESTITWTDMISKTCVYVSRGGVDVREILSTTPSGEQVQWSSSTGVLTFARALESDEFIRGLFQ